MKRGLFLDEQDYNNIESRLKSKMYVSIFKIVWGFIALFIGGGIVVYFQIMKMAEEKITKVIASEENIKFIEKQKSDLLRFYETELINSKLEFVKNFEYLQNLPITYTNNKIVLTSRTEKPIVILFGVDSTNKEIYFDYNFSKPPVVVSSIVEVEYNPTTNKTFTDYYQFQQSTTSNSPLQYPSKTSHPRRYNNGLNLSISFNKFVAFPKLTEKEDRALFVKNDDKIPISWIAIGQ